MITILSTAKDFSAGPQQNALNSWQSLMVNIVTVDDGNLTSWGEFPPRTPTVDSLFVYGLRRAHPDPIVAYVNADIVLLEDFLPAVDAVRQWVDGGPFLMVGRRTNLPYVPMIDWVGDWRAELRSEAERVGKLFNAASDYFVFTGETFDMMQMPHLYIGRYWWDPYLMWHAMKRGVPVVDATKAVLAIHQDHQPNHRSWDPEGQHNRSMVPDEMVESGFDLDDVPYEMTAEREIVKRWMM